MYRILTAIILLLFLVTGYITYLVHERQSELQKLTRYTDSWSVSQIVSEYMRLEARLSAMGLEVKGSEHDEVRLRLEIMMSQIALLQQGDLGKFIGKDPHRKAIVNSLIDLLVPGGRLCIITFHSLEDRIVKNAFKRNENPCTCPPEFPVCVCGKKSKGKVITRKPIVPSEDELERNKRAASSKLRVFERR